MHLYETECKMPPSSHNLVRLHDCMQCVIVFEHRQEGMIEGTMIEGQGAMEGAIGS